MADTIPFSSNTQTQSPQTIPFGNTQNNQQTSDLFGINASQQSPSEKMWTNLQQQPFQSPLQNITNNNSQANVDVAKGAAKGALETASSVGAQNAGPVGAAMTANADKVATETGTPAFSKGFSDLKAKVQPSNAAQVFGKGGERVAEAVVPVDAAVNAFTDTTSLTKPAIDAARGFVEKSVASPEVNAIADKIAPKLTPTEIKLALKEGRIIPGQDATLLRDGTPAQVLPSAKIQSAAETIQRQIPGAKTMETPELYTAIDNKIADISTKLRPQMEAVPIKEDTVSQITKDWMATKAKQATDPYMPTNINLEKLQNSFETDILQASKSDNLGNLWDSRIKYDNSVPASVKNATSLSSDTLQAQKSIWLQNRTILNDAIHNASTGLGKTSQQAFSDMTDLYNAQKVIQSSYKVAKEGAQSRVSKFLQSTTGKVLKTAATALGIGEGGKRLVTGQF